MIDIRDIMPGGSYACKFKVEQMLEQDGGLFTGLNDARIAGLGMYEGFGLLLTRDVGNELVRIQEQKSGKTITVPFAQIWDVDEVEWIETEDDER